jgi:negative regulator of sigma E activity
MTENLSAWMDSELSSSQTSELLLQVRHDAEFPDLCARIFAQLDAEPTVLAPQRRSKAERLHWRPLQVAASIGALVFAGGTWMTLLGLQQDSSQIAANPAPEVKQVAVPAGEGAKDYLLAHQRYSPSNAMQGLAIYVRTMAEVRRADSRPP